MGWLSDRSPAELRDFWEHFGQAADVIAIADAVGGTHGLEVDPERAGAIREALALAATGDFGPYEHALEDLGTRHAERGLDLVVWYDVARALQAAVVPRLIAAYAAEPDRLCASLLTLGELTRRSVGTIAGAFNAQQDRSRRATEARHAKVIETSPDPVIGMDAKGNVTAFNPAAEATFGYTAADAVGRPLAELVIPPRLRAAHERGLARVVAGEPSRVIGQRAEMTAMRADGSELPVELAITATTDPNGVREFIGFLRDLSIRKQAEEATALWSHVLEQAAFGVVISDARSRLIIRANPAYARMTGYDLAALIGKTGEHLVDPDSHGRMADVRDTLREKHHHTYELVLRRSDGTRIPVLSSSSAVQVSADRELLVSTVIDISEMVRARTAELEAANRELEAFSYSVSHDLRGPLRAIDGFSRALADDLADKLDDRSRTDLERIHGAARRMSQLIDGLLALARIGRVPLQLRTIDLTALAEEVVAELRKREPQREVAVAVAPGLRAVGDARLVAVVLENLIGNAWKFTAKTAAPRIEVGFAEGAFYVRDNGAGFDMARAAQLFLPFQRLHQPHDFEGEGIGLATVQRIIGHHGGQLRAEGAIGKGATFHFTFG